MSDVESRLWDSAFDFQRAVLPILRLWLPGDFISVEDAPRHPAVKVVDVVAGIDGWYVTEGSTRLQGIASRVQYGPEPYESFTIRASRSSGAATELEKRTAALRDRDEHYVLPHYTVQSWVERPRTGRALMVLMVRTLDLFEFVLAHLDKVERRRNPVDGSEFLVVWAADLRAAGYEVKEGGEFDITIQLRGGHIWSPYDPDEDFDDEPEDEDEDVYGYWNENDRDAVCAYCGVGGIVGTGERCPACGMFQV
jgi:hypothetical protein